MIGTDGASALLDRTVFYPGGGGQPADSGWLRTDKGTEWLVTGARKAGDDVWHLPEPSMATTWRWPARKRPLVDIA